MPYAGKFFQLLKTLGHFPLVFFDQDFRKMPNVFGFCRRQSTRLDDLLDSRKAWQQQHERGRRRGRAARFQGHGGGRRRSRRGRRPGREQPRRSRPGGEYLQGISVGGEDFSSLLQKTHHLLDLRVRAWPESPFLGAGIPLHSRELVGPVLRREVLFQESLVVGLHPVIDLVTEEQLGRIKDGLG